MDTLIWLIDKITVYLCEYITRQPDYRPITVYLESVSRATRKFPYPLAIAFVYMETVRVSAQPAAWGTSLEV